MNTCHTFKPSELFRPVFVNNPHLDTMADDVLYHFSLGTKTHDLPAMFGDVKVILLIVLLYRLEGVCGVQKVIASLSFSSLCVLEAVPGE